MAGYPVVGVSASCTHDPQGVDIYDEEGNLTHYDLGDTVPLSKLISRRYSWLVNRGYLSEVETDDWGSTVWGEISGTLSSQTDLQNALDAKLNLTGGTLTGLLTITSGANTFGFKNGGSSVTPQFHLGTSGGKSVGLLAGTTGTAFIYDSTGTFNITTDTKANIDAGTSSGGTIRLTMSSTGAVTLTSDLTLSLGNLAISAGYVSLGAVSGDRLMVYGAKGGATSYGFGIESGTLYSRSNARHRWYVGAVADGGTSAKMLLDANGLYPNYLNLVGTADTATAATHYYVETGTDGYVRPKTLANVKSEIVTTAAVNAAAATSLGTLTSDLSISKAGATLNITSSDTGYLLLSGATSASFRLQTSGSSRWIIEKNSTAESGSNAGSDLVFYARTDAGGALSTPLTITRSTGLTTLTSLTVSGQTTLTGNVISNVSIVKASAAFQMASSSGAATIYFDRPAGNSGQLQFRSGSSAAGLRWNVLVNSTAESGSNAGSDFAMYRANDAGSETRVMYVQRSTGNVTFDGSVTAASFATTGTTTTAGIKRALVTKTAAYTLTSADNIVVATAGTWNATLPTAASIAGTEYVIKNSGTGTITVDTTSSQTIDGSLTFGLSQYESITVVSDGANWVII